MELAGQEAKRFNHEYIGTEHILLGLVEEGEGVGAIVLKNLGIDLRKVRRNVEEIVRPGPVAETTGKLTPRAKMVIHYSREEAKGLNHNYVGTEHLLLGLVREEEGVAAQILLNLGVRVRDARSGVLNLLGCDDPQSSDDGSNWMSGVIAHLVQAAPAPPATEPKPRKWTREEYYRLGELGFFHGQRVELIEGDIVVLSPQNWPHSSTVDRVGKLLDRVLGTLFWVRMQLPVNLGTSDPEPDVSVVSGRREDYSDHPTTAVLIVEVSDSTLNYDRTQKASLYARAGIADYWIVNLVNNQLEVHRDSRPDPSQPYGHGYATVTILTPTAVVSPLAAPQVSLALSDLLP
jgi:Uma2 family endonuclease